jgi:hypothetical protein
MQVGREYRVTLAGLEDLPLHAVHYKPGGWFVIHKPSLMRLHPHGMTTKKFAIAAAREYIRGRENDARAYACVR